MRHSLIQKRQIDGENYYDISSSIQSAARPPSTLPTPINPVSEGIKIGEWFIGKKWISQDQLMVALKEQARRSKRLGEVILSLGFISSHQLREALSTLSGLPSVCLTHQILDSVIVHQIPFEIAQKYKIILFSRNDEGAHLAMADPEDLLALDKMRLLFGRQVPLIPYHTTMSEIEEMLEIYYLQSTVDTNENEAVRLVNDIILEAVRLKATDIHLSPHAHRIDVFYRQDGLLHLLHTLHKERWSAISVRLKIMGGIDIAESRRPQNGRFSLTLGGREIDFRLSCHPTIHGENMVIRVLDKAYSLKDLEELGFGSEDTETLKGLVKRPQGLILLSGPTGAGKTTTLYALLMHMDARTRNIMTLEEPIEYNLPNIHQTEIREGGAFRFEEGVRSLLRQDPDVIFISEIRDTETAQMALRASMTGHLVLGTLHASDSFTIPQRLQDLGIPPALLSGNLIAGISQRLIRRLCEDCRHPKILTHEEREKYAFNDSVTHVYEAAGCLTCHQTGYLGREAVVELLSFEEDVSHRIIKESQSGLLRKTAKERGISTLWDRAIEKVLSGKTTLAEVDRVLGGFS